MKINTQEIRNKILTNYLSNAEVLRICDAYDYIAKENEALKMIFDMYYECLVKVHNTIGDNAGHLPFNFSKHISDKITGTITDIRKIMAPFKALGDKDGE